MNEILVTASGVDLMLLEMKNHEPLMSSIYHHGRPPMVYFPRWLLSLVQISLLLSAIFLVRACSLENNRAARAAAIFSGVSSWARAAGVGEVMFGSVKECDAKGGNYLVEGSVYRNFSDPAVLPDVHRWICTNEGKVLRAFSQLEWDAVKNRCWDQQAESEP